MRTLSLTCRMAITRERKRNPGRRSQKLASKPRSKPKVGGTGTPIQRASATRSKSRIPNIAAVRVPAAIPMTEFQARSSRFPRSMRPTTHSKVTAATTGAAAGDAPSGTRVSMANAMGMTVTATSAVSVPDTTGVMMRRSSTRRPASASWQSPPAKTSTPSRAGPPATRASAPTPMEAPEAPMTVSVPPPRPTKRLAWTIVRRPPITMLAKTAQERYSSLWFATRVTIVVTTTTGRHTRTAVCTPITRLATGGGRSSAA